MEKYWQCLGMAEWLGGAEEEHTMLRNTTALRRLLIYPRALRQSVEKVDTSVSLLGGRLTLNTPIGFSPTAFQMYAHPQGEIATAKGADEGGGLMILSAWSNRTLEEVKEKSGNDNLWMNTYIFRNARRTAEIVGRAEKAGYKAIVVTVDIPVLGRRQGSFFFKNYGRFIEPGHFGTDAEDFMECTKGDAAGTWEDFAAICRLTSLPVIAKGIIHADDARQALNHGAAAIFVSNHGGRQMDQAPSTIEVLADIVREVGGACDVYVDGGFRSGMDVFKALSLGATMVFVGRPAFWGLAYDGEKGVAKVLQVMTQQLERTMALSGCAHLSDIRGDDLFRASFI